MSEARPAEPINVVVAGALGRMGAEVVKAVHGAADCQLVGAIDTTPGKEGIDVGEALGGEEEERARRAAAGARRERAASAPAGFEPGSVRPGFHAFAVRAARVHRRARRVPVHGPKSARVARRGERVSAAVSGCVCYM